MSFMNISSILNKYIQIFAAASMALFFFVSNIVHNRLKLLQEYLS